MPGPFIKLSCAAVPAELFESEGSWWAKGRSAPPSITAST